MNERELRGLIDQVKAGGLSRRGFVRRMAAVGLTAPLATQLLAYAGVAMAQAPSTYKPTKRGGGGHLKVLWWQGATLLNPHFAVGTKDQDGSRFFYEPLAGWDASGNLKPMLAESIPGREDGTLAADGKPGDMVMGEINPNYHMPNRPYFDSFEMKGGGDAVSAARAVLQTAEYDFAWNMQVEDEILQRLEKSGKGRVEISPGGNIEHIQLNTTDPWTEVDGERARLGTKHPTLSDPAVRQALSVLVDKDSVEKYIY